MEKIHPINPGLMVKFLWVFTFMEIVQMPSLFGGVTYYVSPSGNNARSGTSPEQAWQTISRVNEVSYGPGDFILFEAWQTFTGSLYFDPNNSSGTASEPITIGSYGGGSATIVSKEEHGLYAYNVGGLHINSLNFNGASTRCEGGGFDGAHGIYFYLDNGASLAHIYIDKVEVTGYCVGIYGYANLPGKYDDIRINQALVHDNLAGGVLLQGSEPDETTGYPLSRLYVGHSQIYNHPGVPYEESGTNVSGSAIFVYQVDNALIEYNTAYNNGGQNTCVDGGDTGGGPFAIWAYGNRITMQHNEVYEQHVSPECPWDGGAFNINGSNSVMQYNYSHDNDGLAFLQDNVPGNANNVIRYNISENDGRASNSQGIIMVTGGSGSYEIYNNTIYASREAGSQGPLVYVGSVNDHGAGAPAGVHFRNNLFVSDNEGTLLWIADPENIADLRFENNAYFDPSGNYLVKWGAPQYLGIETWARATDQERVEGKIVARALDPLLCNPGGGGVISPKPLTALTAYQLQQGSSLIDTGWDLVSGYGLDRGKQDFFANPVPAGEAPDMGAHEYQAGQTCD